PANSGGGGCGAVIDPETPVSADTSAFKGGVGGAGFELVGVCDRCGWNHDDMRCTSLVYSVPTIDQKKQYSAWLELGFDWGDCVQRKGCICSGETPEGCKDIKARLDECLAQP